MTWTRDLIMMAGKQHRSLLVNAPTVSMWLGSTLFTYELMSSTQACTAYAHQVKVLPKHLCHAGLSGLDFMPGCRRWPGLYSWRLRVHWCCKRCASRSSGLQGKLAVRGPMVLPAAGQGDICFKRTPGKDGRLIGVHAACDSVLSGGHCLDVVLVQRSDLGAGKELIWI